MTQPVPVPLTMADITLALDEAFRRIADRATGTPMAYWMKELANEFEMAQIRRAYPDEE